MCVCRLCAGSSRRNGEGEMKWESMPRTRSSHCRNMRGTLSANGHNSGKGENGWKLGSFGNNVEKYWETTSQTVEKGGFSG